LTKGVFIFSVGLFSFYQQALQRFFGECFFLRWFIPLSIVCLYLSELDIFHIMWLYHSMLYWSGVVPLLAILSNTS
jgi:hypothetical protein